jgi:tape measure domain-containing protein
MADKKNTLELQIKIAAREAARAVEGLRRDVAGIAAEAARFGGERGTAIAGAIEQTEEAAASAATSIKLFGAASSDLRQTQARLKASVIDLVENGFDPEDERMRALIDRYKELGEQAGELDDANAANTRSFGSLTDAVQATAAGMALLKTASALKDMAGYALESADTFQRARESFGVLLGDMQAGAALFDELYAFNNWTPFDMDAITQAAGVLLTAKVEAGGITEQMKQLGDLAQGDTGKFISFANTFSKAAAKGEADMEVLNTYLEQGVPILDQLAAQFGKTSGEITKMASEGKIGFEDFRTALEKMTSEGGAYFGNLEISSRSYASMQVGLRESLNALAASFGSMLLPPVNAVLEALTALTNEINESPIKKGVLAGALAAISAALVIMTAHTIADTAAQWLNYAATMARNAAMAVLNPAMLAGIAVAAAATAGMVIYAATQQKAAKAVAASALGEKERRQAVSDTSASYREASASLQDYYDKLVSDDVALEQARNSLRLVETELALTTAAYQRLLLAARSGSFADVRDIKELENRLADLREQALMFQNAVDTKQMRLVDQIYTGTDAGKLEKLRARLAEIKAEMAKGGSAEFLRKAQAAAGYLHDQINAIVKPSGSGKTWQAVLAEALDISQSSFKTGQEAVDLFLAGVDGRLKTKGMLNAELGVTITTDDQREELARLQEDIRSRLQTLFDSGLFDAADNSIRTLIARYRELGGEIENLPKETASLGTDWRDKALTGIEAIRNAMRQSIDELAEEAKDIYGEAYQTQADYQAELFNLELHYVKEMRKEQERESKEERDRIMNAHSLKMDAYKAESEYQAALARKAIESGDGAAADYAQFAVSTASTETAGTDLGGILAGADLIPAFIEAIAGAIMELENVQKTLNFVDTIVKSMMSVTGTLINGAFSEVVDLLEEVGMVIGQVLSPVIGIFAAALKTVVGVVKLVLVPLQLLGGAFEWLYNYVIRPFGNAIIDMINGVIGALNRIPFVNINKIKRLDAIGELAVEMSEEMERYKALLQASFERQKDAVNDLLNSQISGIQKQYKLGLITREDYESQAEKYRAAADEKIYDINVEMEKALESINANTYAALSDTQRAAANEAGSTASSYSEQWGEAVPVVGHIAGAVVDAGAAIVKGAAAAVESVGTWVKSWWPFDAGTSYVPADMPAVVHQGEGIIPKTFNEGIRSGEYALVGRDGAGAASSSPPVYVNIAVTGSVVTERELAGVLYDAVSRGIQSGALSPLPA